MCAVAWKFGSRDFFGRNVTANPAVAGALAGASEAVVNCPFETIKVNLQANPELRGSAAACYRKLVADGGHGALYRGFEAQAYRNLLWNGVYFGVIGYFPAPEGADKATALAHKFAVGTMGCVSALRFFSDRALLVPGEALQGTACTKCAVGVSWTRGRCCARPDASRPPLPGAC